MMTIHTIETIQEWIDGYTFVNNAQTSLDILQQVLGNLPDHGFTYGPTEAGGYELAITGTDINNTFIIKSAE